MNGPEQRYVGKILPGGYRVEQFLAAGGFAWVYCGATSRGERCAIKIPHNATDEGRKRFVRETKILKALPSNPHCVSFVGDGRTKEDLPFVAMEFVDGITLTKALEAWPRWPMQHACALMRQLCYALSGLHVLGVANRDVKPDNIMLTRTWQVKLMDFGLVKDAQGLLRLLESQDILAGRDFAENLDAGMLAGSPEYMAPEQFSDSRVVDPSETQTDTWTDVYSLGLIFYQLLVGQKLFPFDWAACDSAEFAKNLLTYMAARSAFTDDMLVQPSDVPIELWKVIGRALRRDPRRRYRTATDLGLDIERFVHTGHPAEHEEEATSAFDAEQLLAANDRDPSAVVSALLQQGVADPTGEYKLVDQDDEDEALATRQHVFGALAKIYESDPLAAHPSMSALTPLAAHPSMSAPTPRRASAALAAAPAATELPRVSLPSLDSSTPAVPATDRTRRNSTRSVITLIVIAAVSAAATLGMIAFLSRWLG